MDLRAVVQSVLRDIDRLDEALANRREEVEAEGFQLVETNGGADEMTVHDYRTGTCLYAGPAAGFDWRSGRFYEVDSVHEEVDITGFDTAVDGVPDSLMETIREWVEDHDGEAMKFAGAPPEMLS